MEVDIPKTFGVVLVTVIAFTFLIITCVGFYNAYIGYETVVYAGNVSHVNKDTIVFENGDVLFADRIEQFKWELHKEYEITVKNYDIFGEVNEIVDVEII